MVLFFQEPVLMYYPTPMLSKNIIQRVTDTHPCCSFFFHHLTSRKLWADFSVLYTKEKRKKNNPTMEPALREFCLATLSRKSYSTFDLLLIYCKTIDRYTRIVSSCRTEPLRHKAEMLLFTWIWTVTTTLWTWNYFHFGECTGFSWM